MGAYKYLEGNALSNSIHLLLIFPLNYHYFLFSYSPTFQSCTNTNNQTSFVFSFEFVAGSTVNSMSFTVLLTLLDQTKLVVLDTKLSKGMSFTESESGEVEENVQFQRVPPMASLYKPKVFLYI